MRSQRWVIPALLTLTGFSYPQQKHEARESAKTISRSSGTDDFTRLPVKRVVLYKNGVGYFEHSARIHGNQDLGIDFTTAQLNDVLKSLTVVDMGDGRISGVRYNSIAPLDERLKALRMNSCRMLKIPNAIFVQNHAFHRQTCEVISSRTPRHSFRRFSCFVFLLRVRETCKG